MTDLVAYEPNGSALSLGGSALSALAQLSETQFTRQLELLSLAQQRVAAVKRAIMRQDAHYGVIPGTAKPTLLKPGAEVLLQAFGLAAGYRVEWMNGDGITAPDVRVAITCTIHVGSTDGPCVAEGVGEANTWEKKHRRRRAQRTCPQCGSSTIYKSKDEYGGGYYCNQKAGGCGAKFAKNSTVAADLDNQEAGEIDNPDPHDLANTILKMAKKRALLDATLTATASSDLFTQDLDEQDHDAPTRVSQVQAARTSAEARTNGRGQSAPASSAGLTASQVLVNRISEHAGTDVGQSIRALSEREKKALTPRSFDNDPAWAALVTEMLDALTQVDKSSDAPAGEEPFE